MGLFFTKAMCEASCERLHGTDVVIAVSQTILSGHQASSCFTTFHPLVVTNSLVLVGLESTGKEWQKLQLN
jgi:hypothetical protein